MRTCSGELFTERYHAPLKPELTLVGKFYRSLAGNPWQAKMVTVP